MFTGKQIRIFIGIVAILSFLVPFTGFPQAWKNTLTIIFAILIFLAVVQKAVLIEFLRLRKELREGKAEKTRKKPVWKRNKQESVDDEESKEVRDDHYEESE